MTTLPTLRRTTVLAVSLATLGLVAGGCSGGTGGTGGETSADCTSQIRIDGDVYSGYGSSNQGTSEHGVADEADCDDVGRDAEGSVFPDDPRTVTVSSFDGYPPEDVLGVRLDKNTHMVFVADSLSPDERDRILEELGS